MPMITDFRLQGGTAAFTGCVTMTSFALPPFGSRRLALPGALAVGGQTAAAGSGVP